MPPDYWSGATSQSATRGNLAGGLRGIFEMLPFRKVASPIGDR